MGFASPCNLNISWAVRIKTTWNQDARSFVTQTDDVIFRNLVYCWSFRTVRFFLCNTDKLNGVNLFPEICVVDIYQDK